MKTSKFSESKIIEILKQAEMGIALPDLYRQHGISQQTFYRRQTTDNGHTKIEHNLRISIISPLFHLREIDAAINDFIPIDYGRYA